MDLDPGLEVFWAVLAFLIKLYGEDKAIEIMEGVIRGDYRAGIEHA